MPRASCSAPQPGWPAFSLEVDEASEGTPAATRLEVMLRTRQAPGGARWSWGRASVARWVGA